LFEPARKKREELGSRHATRMPIKQLNAELGLGMLDVLAQRGCDVRRISAARERLPQSAT
jgi:hypothetical protein